MADGRDEIYTVNYSSVGGRISQGDGRYRFDMPPFAIHGYNFFEFPVFLSVGADDTLVVEMNILGGSTGRYATGNNSFGLSNPDVYFLHPIRDDGVEYGAVNTGRFLFTGVDPDNRPMQGRQAGFSRADLERVAKVRLHATGSANTN